MKRPTLRDIAAIAHVSHVTVSLALRKHPSIPPTTRERIEKIAKEIGYHPDPALSALIQYRQGVKPSNYQATLAWIDARLRPGHDDSYIGNLFRGARERSAELGYQLEEFRLIDVEMNFDRLSKILYARNIQGVFFTPQDHAHTHINYRSFAWDRYSAITFGFSLESPQLDVVIDAQYRSARTAVRKLRGLGYRRIGYASYREFDETTDGNFIAGYLAEQLSTPVARRIPPLSPMGRNFNEEYRKWYRRYRPDAIFSVGKTQWAPIVEGALDPKDISDGGTPNAISGGQPYWVPMVEGVLDPEETRGCGIAVHALSEGQTNYAGIRPDFHQLGQIGADEVIAMINSNRRGIPRMPKRIMVEGFWQDGPSAPRVAFQ